MQPTPLMQPPPPLGPPPPVAPPEVVPYPPPGATVEVAVPEGLVSTDTLPDDCVDGVVLVSELPLPLLLQPTASVRSAAPLTGDIAVFGKTA